MAEWPEPEADPEEPRRWWGRGALVAAAAAAAVLLANSGDVSWRLPEISLPEFDLPEASTPDLRGRNGAPEPPSVSESTNDALSITPTIPADGSPLIQPASFEACVGTIERAATALGPPALIEDNADRRVARFKLAEGAIVVTCSRGDGTMRIEQQR